MTFEQTPNTKTYHKINLSNEYYNFQTKVEAENPNKIIAISCKPTTKNNELIANNLSVIGNANLQILYLDNENKLKSIIKTIEYSTTFENIQGSQFFIVCEEKETNAQILSETEIIINSTFEFKINTLVCNEIVGVKPGSLEIFEKVKNIEVQTLSAVADDKILIVDESDLSADRILKCESACNLTKTNVVDNVIIVDGELLVWLCSELEGNIKNTFKRIEFSSEISAMGARPENLVDANLKIDSCVASISQSGTSGILNINATLKVEALVFANKSIDLLEDAYSDKNELIISSTGFLNEKFVAKQSVENELTITLTTKEKTVNLGSILAVTSPFVTKNEKGAVVECTIIYKHAETDNLESVILSSPINQINPDIISNIIIKSFSKKKAKEVDVELAVICSNIQITECYELYTSSIEVGPELEQDNKSVIVYQAVSGQTIFSIAKDLKVNPQILKEQNSNLEDIMPQDKKIVLYKRALAQF